MSHFWKCIYTIFSSCFLLILIPEYGYGKANYSIAPVPEWVSSTPYNNFNIHPENVSDGYRFVLKDFQSDVEKEALYFHFIRKITSEAGVQNGSELDINFDPSYQTLFIHNVSVIRGGDRINKLDKEKIKVIQREKNKERFIFDGTNLAYLILEDIRVGDYIEYSYTIKGRNPIYNSKYLDAFYLNFYDKIEKLKIRIITDSKRKLNFNTRNEKVEPEILQKGNLVEYIWERDDVPGLIMDNDCPVWYNPYTWLEVSEYSSWEEVNSWAEGLFKIKELHDTALLNKVEWIKNKYRKSEDRVVATLNFVQNEVRYLGLESGIGAYKPEAPETVFKNRYGDCKGKSLLFCAMLRRMDIEAFPALVNTISKQEIVNDLPSPSSFNHCIAGVKIDDVIRWYDPTSSMEGGGFDKRYIPDYKYALIIGGKDKGLSAVQGNGEFYSSVKEKYRILEIGGETELEVKSLYRGPEADNQRYYFATNNPDQIQKNYLNFYAKSFPKIAIQDKIRFEDNIVENEFVVYESYIIQEFWMPIDSLGDSRNIQCSVYPDIIREKLRIPSTRVRSMPFYLGYPMEIKQSQIFYLPEDWNVQEEEQNIESDGVSFSKRVSYENRVLAINYKLKYTKDHIGQNEIHEFIKAQNKISNSLGHYLSYKPIQENVGPSFTIVMITIASLILSSLLFFYLYRWDPKIYISVSESRPLGGWLILPLLGLIITPFRLLLNLSELNYFDGTMWEAITNSTYTTYNPGLAFVVGSELFLNIMIFIYTIFLIIIFIKRRSSVIYLFPLYYAFNLVVLIADALFTESYLETNHDISSWTDILKMMVGAAIWIPYILLSERAKETFVETYKINKKEPEGEGEQVVFKYNSEY